MQILSTKLTMPPLRSRLVARPRLIQKLELGLECGFVLVSAPAGYGKSTLLSAWLSRGEFAAAWLSLDDGDNDPVRFLTYLAAALSKVIPAVSEAVENSLQASALPSIEILLTPLVNAVAQVDQPFWLVLDDYHMVQNQQVQQMVRFLLDHRPMPLHLAIATRADPPLPLNRLRARSALLELRQADLCFTAQEAADFLHHTMGIKISPEDVACITTRTEGWIAGLQIAALSLQNTDDISGFIVAFAGSHHYIFEYLLDEILERQPLEIHRFLLYTSVLDQFTPALCDALLAAEVEFPHSRPSSLILEDLEHANLFIVPLDHEHRWYRYHHLFSDLLKPMLEQGYPGHAVELHRRACCWYEAQGMPREALQHAISAGDMQLVAHIISANVLVLVESNEIAPILEKIDSLSTDDMIALPWLGIARAWALSSGQVEKSLRVLDAVEKNVEIALDRAEYRRLKGHIAAARAFVSGAKGDRSAAIAHGRDADELLPADEIAVRAMNLTILGDMLVADGHGPDALPILKQALALALQAGKVHMIMLATSSLATAHLFAGRLFELHRVCLDALAIAEDYQSRFQQSLSATAEVYSLLARALAEWGENEQAIQFAQKGAMLSEQWGRINTETLCLVYLGRALMFNNDREQALQAVERADRIAQRISFSYWQYNALFSLESMLDCESPDARSVDQLMRRLQESGARFPDVLTARLLLRENRPAEALAALEQALSALRGQPSFDTVRVFALRALAFQAQGEERQALTELQRALELGEPENRLATFVREGAAMEKLLRLALAKSIAPAFIQRLLAAFEARRKPQPAPALAAEGLLESLSERELEVLKLLAQGYSDKKIAETLVIARETVHKHLKNIYGKLDVHSRSEAIARARELGLL